MTSGPQCLGRWVFNRTLDDLSLCPICRPVDFSHAAIIFSARHGSIEDEVVKEYNDALKILQGLFRKVDFEDGSQIVTERSFLRKLGVEDDSQITVERLLLRDAGFKEASQGTTEIEDPFSDRNELPESLA
ncbi:hypothetical protein K432DRAFT_397229 [Lepidopterella palustris CBS 459.81]|uniref:Uncharacterized protein n=1 Tax=Lepidopterella palustris CBS 459.81 TaxID=1314670 RepID=A0A8E2JAQ9_9PEZI|nr:hypothetical protein K432DRAFT_397229 [Lepidopterella palustris CBS 459.81]